MPGTDVFISLSANMMFVADAAEIVCGAKVFMWSKIPAHAKQFLPHEKLSCRAIVSCESMTN